MQTIKTALVIVMLLCSVLVVAKRRIPNTDETFFMPQPMKDNNMDIILSAQDRVDDTVSSWPDGNDPSLNILPPLSATCTCRWNYVVVHNPHRIPSTTLEAVCLTKFCTKSTNSEAAELSSRDEDDSSSTLGECKAVEYMKWVKVKSKVSKGKWKYVRRLLPVNVGCTCDRN